MKKILVSLAAVIALGTSAYAGVNSQTGCGLDFSGHYMILSGSITIFLSLSTVKTNLQNSKRWCQNLIIR